MGLFCDHIESKCRPLLGEGQPCTNPLSCAAGLECRKDLTTMSITCRPPAPGP
jgi:hypothetical protein